jgi:hypothetical protein
MSGDKLKGAGACLTLDMLEKAMEIAAGNFGTPDSIMMSDDAFDNLRGMMDPEWIVKHSFNEAISKMLWPERYPRVWTLEDVLANGY